MTPRNRLRCDAPGVHRKSYSLPAFVRRLERCDWGMAVALLLSVERERQMGGERL
ncbi:MAG: hypothetical protein HY814_09985 [Candidatus Riflebacteria bacterium]|nr:hypothetical protein [Candidatus Riflebacteria bacterium]